MAQRCGEPAGLAPVQQHERERRMLLRLRHEIPGVRIGVENRFGKSGKQWIEDKPSENKPGSIAPGFVVEQRNALDELHKDPPIDRDADGCRDADAALEFVGVGPPGERQSPAPRARECRRCLIRASYRHLRQTRALTWFSGLGVDPSARMTFSGSAKTGMVRLEAAAWSLTGLGWPSKMSAGKERVFLGG